MYRDISLQSPLRRIGTIQLPKQGLQHASQYNPCRQVDITPVASLGISSMQVGSRNVKVVSVKSGSSRGIMTCDVTSVLSHTQDPHKERILHTYLYLAST